MKNHLNPFTQGKDSLWHWKTECSDFPTEKNARVLVSISFPKDIELCPKCNEIYLHEASQKRMSMSVVNDHGLFKY